MLLYFLPSLLFAGQTVIADYDSARDDYFWDELYIFGGLSLYCSTSFDADGVYNDYNGSEKKMTLEHVYSADWIADHHSCANRDSCQVTAYKHAEADLHNLWPAQGGVNSSRSNHPFGEIPDELSVNRYADRGCDDFERLYNVGDEHVLVEPQDSVKCRIARSMLYMNSEYGLPLRGMEALMLRWHIKHPVDSEELWRNYVICKLQGTYNPWIRQVK